MGDMFAVLSWDVILYLFGFLEAETLLTLRLVSHAWRQGAGDETMWRYRFLQKARHLSCPQCGVPFEHCPPGLEGVLQPYCDHLSGTAQWYTNLFPLPPCIFHHKLRGSVLTAGKSSFRKAAWLYFWLAWVESKVYCSTAHARSPTAKMRELELSDTIQWIRETSINCTEKVTKIICDARRTTSVRDALVKRLEPVVCEVAPGHHYQWECFCRGTLIHSSLIYQAPYLRLHPEQFKGPNHYLPCVGFSRMVYLHLPTPSTLLQLDAIAAVEAYTGHTVAGSSTRTALQLGSRLSLRRYKQTRLDDEGLLATAPSSEAATSTHFTRASTCRVITYTGGPHASPNTEQIRSLAAHEHALKLQMQCELPSAACDACLRTIHPSESTLLDGRRVKCTAAAACSIDAKTDTSTLATIKAFEGVWVCGNCVPLVDTGLYVCRECRRMDIEVFIQSECM